ncbi:hypothetical protein [Hoeflea sp.]|uniref:hypothetical protein n=1 Tax=Hoeflea sp. TaxID=1940281 RepID=UPI003B528BF8
MTTPFADLEILVSDAVDSLMAEPTRIIRKKRGEIFAGTADGARATVDVVGVVDLNPLTVVAQDQGQYDGFQPTLAANKVHVSYKHGVFASRDAWPKQDDRIVALVRAGPPTYRVTKDAEDDGIGRVLCICVPE